MPGGTHRACCCGQTGICYRAVLCPCPEGEISAGAVQLRNNPGGCPLQGELFLGEGVPICTDADGNLPDGFEIGETYKSIIPGQGSAEDEFLCWTITDEIVPQGVAILNDCGIVLNSAVPADCSDPDCCVDDPTTAFGLVLQWCGPCEEFASPPLSGEDTTQLARVEDIPIDCDIVQLQVNGATYCFEVVRPEILVPEDSDFLEQSQIGACFDTCYGVFPDPNACCEQEPPPPQDCRACFEQDAPGICPEIMTLNVPALQRFCCRWDGTEITGGQCGFGADCEGPPEWCYGGEFPCATTLVFEANGDGIQFPWCGGEQAATDSCGSGDPFYNGEWDAEDGDISCIEAIAGASGDQGLCQSCTNGTNCAETVCIDNQLHPEGEFRWRLQVSHMGRFVLPNPSICPLGEYRWCRFAEPAQPPTFAPKVLRQDGNSIFSTRIFVL